MPLQTCRHMHRSARPRRHPPDVRRPQGVVPRTSAMVIGCAGITAGAWVLALARPGSFTLLSVVYWVFAGIVAVGPCLDLAVLVDKGLARGMDVARSCAAVAGAIGLYSILQWFTAVFVRTQLLSAGLR